MSSGYGDIRVALAREQFDDALSRFNAPPIGQNEHIVAVPNETFEGFQRFDIERMNCVPMRLTFDGGFQADVGPVAEVLVFGEATIHESPDHVIDWMCRLLAARFTLSYRKSVLRVVATGVSPEGQRDFFVSTGFYLRRPWVRALEREYEPLYRYPEAPLK